MKIKFVKQEKPDWGIAWAKKLKVFILSVGRFALQISFGKRPFDADAYAKFLKETFDKRCQVCKQPLNVTAIGQVVKYHRKCRKYKNHPERYAAKN